MRILSRHGDKLIDFSLINANIVSVIREAVLFGSSTLMIDSDNENLVKILQKKLDLGYRNLVEPLNLDCFVTSASAEIVAKNTSLAKLASKARAGSVLTFSIVFRNYASSNMPRTIFKEFSLGTLYLHDSAHKIIDKLKTLEEDQIFNLFNSDCLQVIGRLKADGPVYAWNAEKDYLEFALEEPTDHKKVLKSFFSEHNLASLAF